MKKSFYLLTFMFMSTSCFAQSVVFKNGITDSPVFSAILEQQEDFLIEDNFNTAPEPQPVIEPEVRNEMPMRPKPVQIYNGSSKIVALVNGEIISSKDMQSGVNMFIANSGIAYNDQTKDMIFHRVMQNLIDEKLKINEAKKNGIVISDNEIKKAIASFAESNNINLADLDKVLAQDGVDASSFRAKMEADIAWQKLVGKKMAAYSSISPMEVKKEKEAIAKDLKKSRYMISEIVISAKNAKDISSLAEILREDPRFDLYAMQFSESASASRGGDLGWVNKDTLDPKLVKQLEKMNAGDVSDPVRIGKNYHIVKLASKYNPAKDNSKVPSDAEVRNYLQNKKTDEVVNRYGQDLRNRAIIEIRE